MQGGSPEIGFQRSKPAALIRGFIYGTRTQWFFLNSPSKSPFLVIQIPKPIWTCHIFRLCSLGEDGWSTIGEPRHLASPNYGEKRLVDNKKWVFSATKSNTLSNKSIQTDTLFQQYIFFSVESKWGLMVKVVQQGNLLTKEVEFSHKKSFTTKGIQLFNQQHCVFNRQTCIVTKRVYSWHNPQKTRV